MIKMDLDHCLIVSEHLATPGIPDEQTLASFAVLEDRLERLKHISPRYSKISFSPMARHSLKRILTPVAG